MPIKRNNIRQHYKQFTQEVWSASEDAVTKIMIIGQAHAASLTPIDTSNLINSAYREITTSGGKVIGAVGYTANYAGYVHDAPGKLLGTNTPRSSSDIGRGNVWDPDAEPEFLVKGFEREGADEIRQIILQEHSKVTK